MRRKTASKEVEPTPVVRSLRLADGSPAEAFGRLAAAIDSGEVTIQEGKAIADILERRLRILDAEEFRKRLELAEARSREAARLSRPMPASRTLLEVPKSTEPST